MIPILFDGSETDFDTNGVGRLSDAISCIVTEKRNGAYELLMKYPIDGIHFEDIELGMYIFAKPSKYSDNQPFEIYQITKPLNGVCEICAYHISYRLANIPVMPFSAADVASALTGLSTYSAETNPFTFTTTKTTVADYDQTEPRDARSCLGGVSGSILDVFGGGDYEFDMFSVKLWENRGSDRGFQVRYGKNLTDIKQEESIENTVTGIVPFYKNDSTTVTLTEEVIETASADNYPYPRTVVVDLSSYFQDSVPTEAQLRTCANSYISAHSLGVPNVNLDVSFVNLADTKGYEDIAVLEDVRLCDTVTVIFEKLGVEASAKVVTTEYDTLKERFTKIELGSQSKNSLADRIASIEQVQTESSSVLDAAIARATSLITGESGGYVIFHTNSEGKPYEILIMDTEDIDTAVHVWRWNQAGWGYSSTGYNGTYTLAATIDGGIVADFITAGTITGIEYNNGSGTFHVTAAGALTATSATITGAITATSGYIGTAAAGFEINSSYIANGKSSLTDSNSGVYIGTDGIALGASSAFKVDSSGNLTATNATISGTISSATITGGTITGTTINNGSGTFVVDSSGNLTATSATITGTISSSTITGGTITGTEIATGTSGYNFLLSGQCLYLRDGTTVVGYLQGYTNSLYYPTGQVLAFNVRPFFQQEVFIMSGLELHNGSTPYIDFHETTGADYNCRIITDGSSNFTFVQYPGTAYSQLTAAAYNIGSSRLIKENITDISEEDAVKVLDLRPVDFDYTNTGEHSHGMIAEEVYDIYPDLVHMPKDWNEDEYDGSLNVPSLDYSKFVPYLIKMVQILQREIDELKGE